MKHIFTLFMLFALAACATNISPDSYSADTTGKATRTVRGEIVTVRDVQVEGNEQGTGTLIGAVGGGIAGSTLGGSSRANTLGAIGGAVLGGVAGNAIERNVTEQNGVEYVIETESGKLITIVQGPESRLRKGDPVFVIFGDKTRVVLDSE